MEARVSKALPEEKDGTDGAQGWQGCLILQELPSAATAGSRQQIEGHTQDMASALRKISQDHDIDSGTATGPRPLLDQLRHAASGARCKSYIDMFGACAALSGNRHVAGQAASEILMRCLSQALGRRPVLFREGVRETSFDEDWLLALARSLKDGDTLSATFLLRSRVPKHACRNLVLLLRAVVDEFD
ncbi:MAG: hypothetical protein WEB56_07515 [Roseovarius sp.]